MVAGSTTHSGGGSVGGIVPADEDEETPLGSVCMEACLSILLEPWGTSSWAMDAARASWPQISW